MNEKKELRGRMRALRSEHVAALPQTTRALLFLRPPAPVAALAPAGSIVGLYHATGAEAPTRGYAHWFHENGCHVALPRFEGRDAAMEFRVWHDPYDDDALEPGPHGHLQPRSNAPAAVPQCLFVPLIAFTAEGERLGQGGGHYDRWLAAHSDTVAIGLAWDCQLVDALPVEPHDRPLRAVVTPTRFYEGEH